MPQSPQGTCALCDKVVTKSSVSRHLLGCREEHISGLGKHVKHYHLAVEGEGVLGKYWMHLDVPASSTLSALDEFLKDTWLECCGHLSAFTIDGLRYEASPDNEWGPKAKNMKVKLYDVLQSDSEFRHEYDFGSTTELGIRVIAEHVRPLNPKESIHVLARNNPPETLCVSCGKEATQLCGECDYDEPGHLCDDCIPKHEHDEEMFLPIVNSPRTGVCGYEG